jgi:serine/threonine-protein kinase
VASRQVQHPGLVGILEVIAEPTRVTVVRPALTEWTFSEMRLEPYDAARIVAELAETVAHLHTHGLFLGSLELDDLQVTNDGRVLLTYNPHPGNEGDLGWAMTSFSAPERISAAAPPSVAADVFSLGALLYRLLTRRDVYASRSRRAPRLPELAARLQSGSWSPVPPETVKPKLPAELARIALQAVALKPEDRPASADALASALRAFLASDTSNTPDRGKRFWK